MSDSRNGEHVKSLALAMRICRPLNPAGRLKIAQTLDRCGPCPWPTIRGFYSNSAGVAPVTRVGRTEYSPKTTVLLAVTDHPPEFC
jgi:hypothetical protein